jgi:hypothetical protein
VAQCYRAAVYIQPFGIKTKFAIAGNHLRRKSLV